MNATIKPKPPAPKYAKKCLACTEKCKQWGVDSVVFCPHFKAKVKR